MTKATRLLLDKLSSSIQSAIATALSNILKDCDINVKVAIRSPGEKNDDITKPSPKAE